MQGIVTGCCGPPDFYIPHFLPEDVHIPSVEMKAARPDSIEPALDGMEDALKKYPPGFGSKVISTSFENMGIAFFIRKLLGMPITFEVQAYPRS